MSRDTEGSAALGPRAYEDRKKVSDRRLRRIIFVVAGVVLVLSWSITGVVLMTVGTEPPPSAEPGGEQPALLRPSTQLPAPAQTPPPAPTPTPTAGVVLTTMDRQCLRFLAEVQTSMTEARVRADYETWRRDVLPSCEVLADGVRELCSSMEGIGLDPLDEADLAALVIMTSSDITSNEIRAGILTWCTPLNKQLGCSRTRSRTAAPGRRASHAPAPFPFNPASPTMATWRRTLRQRSA